MGKVWHPLCRGWRKKFLFSASLLKTGGALHCPGKSGPAGDGVYPPLSGGGAGGQAIGSRARMVGAGQSLQCADACPQHGAALLFRFSFFLYFLSFPFLFSSLLALPPNRGGRAKEREKLPSRRTVGARGSLARFYRICKWIIKNPGGILGTGSSGRAIVVNRDLGGVPGDSGTPASADANKKTTRRWVAGFRPAPEGQSEREEKFFVKPMDLRLL